MRFSKKVRSKTAVATAAFCIAASAWAVDPFTVRDIRVEGLQRVEAGTVFATLPFRVGDTYNDEKGTAAIRALFALGLFNDIRLEVNGDVLVVIVQERPVIANIDITGAKEFDKDALLKSLKDVGLAEGRPFDKALADRAEQELKRQYVSRSRYAASVQTTATPIDRNRVNLGFSVVEGETATIGSLRIVGNTSFSQSTLRDVFSLNTTGWLSFYTKNDRYSREKLNGDLEALRSFYRERGYLEMSVDSTQVAITPDKQSIEITVNITEGPRYIVTGVKLDGNYLGRDEEFKQLITIKPGQAYNSKQIEATSKAFSDYFATFGYAFANVSARPEIDRANGRVAFTLVADPGRRAYVRRILIGGNSRTRDEVIRREFRQMEASWYDGEKIKRSRERVQRLGFFEADSVEIDTRDVPNAPDQIDLLVTVKEKPTGSFNFGASFSSSERSLNFGVKQDNVFGSGNYLALDLNTSRTNRSLQLSTSNPYFTKDGISQSLDVFHRSTKPYSEAFGDYSFVTTGASVRYGVPFSETDTVFFGLGLESINIKAGANTPALYLAYADRFGARSSSFPLTVGWARDSRDNLLAPNRGRLLRLNAEASPAGDARFFTGIAQYQEYFPITKAFTFAFNTELYWGKGLNDRPYPVFKNQYAGGLGSVRGFEQSSLGPRDINGSPIGGARKFNVNAEVLTPLPGTGNDKTIRVYAFVDVGNVYGESEKFDLSKLRSSVGVGVGWQSPLGPLRLAVAKPLKTQPGDRIQKLQFQVGTSF